jgi:hypothetical protein
VKTQASHEKPDIDPFGTYRAQDHAISFKKSTPQSIISRIKLKGKGSWSIVRDQQEDKREEEIRWHEWKSLLPLLRERTGGDVGCSVAWRGGAGSGEELGFLTDKNKTSTCNALYYYTLAGTLRYVHGI